MQKLLIQKILSLFILSILLALSSQAKEQVQWNVLFYFNGKVNLELKMKEQLAKLEQAVGSSSRINLIVEWGELSTGKVIRYRSRKVKTSEMNEIQSPPIQILEGRNMGTKEALVDFVTWSQKKFPSQKTVLIMGSHGKKWEGDTDLFTNFDDAFESGLNVHQFAQAFQLIKTNIGRPIDLLILDMCLVGSFEIATQLYGNVQFVVANREETVDSGIDYAGLFKKFIRTPKLSIRDLVYLVIRHSKVNPVGDDDPTYLSALNLRALSSLVGSLKKTLMILARLDAASQDSAKKIIRNYPFYRNQDETTGEKNQHVDFLEMIHAFESLKLAPLEPVLKQMRLDYFKFFFNSYVSGTGMTGSGVSIYFPEQKEKSLLLQYKHLRFDGATQWSQFIHWAL